MTRNRDSQKEMQFVCKHKRKRMYIEDDRLSNLPDDLIHKILSSFDIKHAVQTSVLSSRWRYVWTSTPDLNFSSEHFTSLPKFAQFVNHVFSGRKNEREVSSVKLSFRGKTSQVSVKRIFNYAFSHNVQQMTITSLDKKNEFPLSVLRSQSLKYLTLIGFTIDCSSSPTSTWDLSALTMLSLDRVTLHDDNSDHCVGLLSKCINLENLTLKHCKTMGSNGLSICHPRLSNLTFEKGEIVNVIAPQLKILSLVLLEHSFPSFSEGLPSLEKVDLCIDNPNAARACNIVDLLQDFHGVKFLTLNWEITEVLSSSVELISNQPSPFVNLMNLKVYPLHIHSVVLARSKVNMSAEVKNYFLDSSPSATCAMVSREDIISVKNTALAQKAFAELQVLLDRLKTPMEIHKAKAQLENQTVQLGTEMPLHIGGRMDHIQKCWEDLALEIHVEKTNTCSIFTKLQYIEGLLAELPASKRVKMQASFSSLCVQVDTFKNDIIDCMKLRCDTKRSHLSRYFHELATAL